MSALPVLDNLQAAGADGPVGDTMVYWTRVSNPGNTTLTDVRLNGDLTDLTACGAATLAPGADYVCKSGRRTVTRTDLDQGFAPRLTVSATTPDGTEVSTAVTGDRIDIH
ncbi:DUF7507 domain-containing protein [Streptomyces cellulosae]